MPRPSNPPKTCRRARRGGSRCTSLIHSPHSNAYRSTDTWCVKCKSSWAGQQLRVHTAWDNVTSACQPHCNTLSYVSMQRQKFGGSCFFFNLLRTNIVILYFYHCQQTPDNNVLFDWYQFSLWAKELFCSQTQSQRIGSATMSDVFFYHSVLSLFIVRLLH